MQESPGHRSTHSGHQIPVHTTAGWLDLAGSSRHNDVANACQSPREDITVKTLVSTLLALVAAAAGTAAAAPTVQLKSATDSVKVTIDGKPFATYNTSSK